MFPFFPMLARVVGCGDEQEKRQPVKSKMVVTIFRDAYLFFITAIRLFLLIKNQIPEFFIFMKISIGGSPGKKGLSMVVVYPVQIGFPTGA